MFECDYYTNPTVLSQCIRMEEYTAASRRLAKHPDEARVFVCRRIHLPAKTTDAAKVAVYQPTAERQVITTSRTLPIHMVLAQSSLPVQSSARNQLLSELITAYPESCRIRADGRYVLESLIVERSTTQLVSLALAAFPEAIETIDETIPMPPRLVRLLQRGVRFWKRVQSYANIIGSEDDAPSVAHISLKSNGIQDYKALEQRCLALERLLLAANAENYELQQENESKDRTIAKLRTQLGGSTEEQSAPQSLAHPPPPRSARSTQYRQDCTNTIVSGLTNDQSRFPSRKSSFAINNAKGTINPSGEDAGDSTDDENTVALLESICRPMSPYESVGASDSATIAKSTTTKIGYPPRPARSRRQDCTNTIVSSISRDQSRFPSRQSSSGMSDVAIQQDGKYCTEDDDDDDTEALMEFINRPISPEESQDYDNAIVAVENPYPMMPNLDDTEVSEGENDDATMDTVLREAELWRGRKLSPKIIQAWKQIPVSPPKDLIQRLPMRHSFS